MSFGRPYIMATDGCIHDGWLVLSPKTQDIHPDYFYHLLASPIVYAEFKRLAAGATVKNLNIDLVKGVSVPLPPLTDQRRIATILDQTDTLRKKRRAMTTGLHRLRYAAFFSIFGSIGSSSRKRIPLGEVAKFIGGGTPSRKNSSFFTGDICWASSKDITSELIFDTQEHVSAEAVANSATTLVPAGVVLVVVKSKILLRRLPVAIAKVPLCFNQDIKAIRAEFPYSPDFILMSLLMDQSWLLRKARGANTEGLTLDHLRSFPIAVPTGNEIGIFGAQMARLETLSNKMSTALTRLDELYFSFQHELFDSNPPAHNIISSLRSAAE